MTMLNKKSGVFGLSNNLSSDFRDLTSAAESGNEIAATTVDVFCYRVATVRWKLCSCHEWCGCNCIYSRNW